MPAQQSVTYPWPEASPPEELERLARHLGRAQQFRLFLLICGSPRAGRLASDWLRGRFEGQRPFVRLDFYEQHASPDGVVRDRSVFEREVLGPLLRPAQPGAICFLDLTPSNLDLFPIQYNQTGADLWRGLFQKMNELRNSIRQALMAGVLVLCLPPELADEFSRHAPDFWSIRGETFRLNVPTAAAPAWQNAIFSRLLRDTAALSASGWIHLTIPQADVMVALDGEPERTIERAQRAGDLALALNLHERGLQYLWRGHDRKAALCFSASLRLRSDGHTPSALWFPTARLVFWAHHRCALPVPPGTIESVLTWINKLPPERELRPSSIELALLVDALVRGGEAWLGVEIFRRYQHDFEDSVYAISDIYGHAQSDRERWSGQIVLPIFQESGSWKKQIFQGKSALRDLGLLLNAEDHNRIGEPFYRETLALLRGRFMDVWLRLGESATAPEPPRGQAPYSLGDLERLVLTSGLLAIERSEWPARSRCWISALPAPPQPWGSGLVLLDELALCWWCFYRRQVAELAELRGDQLEARAAWGELRSGLATLRLYPAAAEYAQGLGELAG